MKEIQRVVIDPNICHGKPTIRGTRIMVSNILSLIRGGYTTPQILEYYPELTEEDVKAAIDYAAAVIEEETILTGTP